MLADTAVACHPNPDKSLAKQIVSLKQRIKTVPKREIPPLQEELEQIEQRKSELLPHLLQLREMAEQGRKVLLPLMERELPLIQDEWAKPELGSGCVKITPAHDPNDYEVWQRHRNEIAIINILNPDGSLNTNAGAYAGLDRLEAREKVIKDLNSKNLMEEIEGREIEIGHSDRSKSPIEPFLSKQWFIKMGDIKGGIICGTGTGKEFRASGLAQAAIDASGREYQSPSGRRLTFYPDHVRYGGTYQAWLSEKRDWCISRQLWWGHRIPIWHGNFSVSELKNKVPALPDLDDENLCIWISDTEGTHYRTDQLSELNSKEKYDVLVCPRDEKVQKKYTEHIEAAGLEQDPDVLDTWLSSALWPFSTLGWPDPATAVVDEGQRPLGSRGEYIDCLSYYYPGSCLVTGRDIITLWVARMQVMGLYLLGDVPFTDSFIHANIQDGKGERMSKSKGNGIDPTDIIEKYGADAMRYILCVMQTGTQDIRLPVQVISPFTGKLIDLATAQHGQTIFTYICPDTGKEFDVLGTMPDLPMAKIISERFDVGRAFCTKLWNAARFALMNLGKHSFEPLHLNHLVEEDRWILSRLSSVISKTTEQLEAYNPSAAISIAREFFWSELCDWYLEFIKPRFKLEESAPVARSVLAFAMDQVLRLFHPFVPFITEVLWERLAIQCPVRGLEKPLPTSALLISSSWPEQMPELLDDQIESDFDLTKDIIRAIREIRSQHNLPPRQKIKAQIKAGDKKASTLKRFEHLILNMGRLESLEVSSDITPPSTATIQPLGDVELYLTGVIDPSKERERLQKKRRKLQEEAKKSESRLKNENFLKQAPADVVGAEKKKLGELKSQIQLINKNLNALRGS
jgi:valyl-tRNA synthetase